MSAPRPYTKLPGRGYRARGCLLVGVARHTLWLGDDHLLSVDWWGYSEEYHRFAYRDIQTISVRRTKRFFATALVLAAIVVGLAAWSAAAGEVGAVVLRVFAGLFGLALLVELLRGPTCRVALRTAVHEEELPAWGRLRAYRKGMALLRPRIAAAQPAPAMPPVAPEPQAAP